MSVDSQTLKQSPIIVMTLPLTSDVAQDEAEAGCLSSICLEAVVESWDMTIMY